MRVILLSGGMDSCVTLFYALSESDGYINPIFFDYGQRSRLAEYASVRKVMEVAEREYPGRVKPLDIVRTHDLFVSESSILQSSGVAVDSYESVDDAIQNTPFDKSQIPLRNMLLVTIAAHRALSFMEDPEEVLEVLIGIRGRYDSSVPGFPDCTKEFSQIMSASLQQASGRQVVVSDPLNTVAKSREDTIRLASTLRGCWYALAGTVSCFNGFGMEESPNLTARDKRTARTFCGRCLPCLRRAQAFANVGMSDPALEGVGNEENSI